MGLMEIINNADFSTPYVIICDPNYGCSCKQSYTDTCTCKIGSKCGTFDPGCVIKISW